MQNHQLSAVSLCMESVRLQGGPTDMALPSEGLSFGQAAQGLGQETSLNKLASPNK